MSCRLFPLLLLGLGVAGSSVAAGFGLQSTAFSAGEMIPARYTCDGESVSPPLAWHNAPAATRSFALIVDDPDAPGGTYVHWVLYDLPVTATHLDAHLTPDGAPAGARFGVNSRSDPAYTGPCPPSGTHHYHFKLYALDIRIGGDGHLSKTQLLAKMRGHVVGEAALIGIYRRH